MPFPDALYVTCMPLHWIIRLAYNIESDDRMLGEPDWDRHANYNITAKVAPSDVARFRNLNRIQWGVMLQAVLADRFRLKVHYKTKVRPVYMLVVAKGGPKLDSGEDEPPMMAMRKRGQMKCQNCQIDAMPMFLSQLVGSTVLDNTGLTGHYDFTLHWVPEMPSETAPAGDSGPSIFTALREQLGLKLEYRKAPVDVLVIDRLEKLSPN